MPQDKVTVTYLTATAEHAGRRLDNFLLSFVKGVPRSHMYKLIRAGQVRVNSRRAKQDYRIAAGDRVRVPPVRVARGINDKKRAPSAELCAATERAIFYRAERLIALNKPAGKSVHGGTGEHAGIIEALNHLYPPVGDEGNWHLVYRLDKETTGCLLAVQGADLKKSVQARWHDADCQKIYRLAVCGNWPPHLSVLTGTVGKTRTGGEHIVRPMAAEQGGKQAITHFRLLATGDNFSLLEAELRTGRTHQIRSQCAFAGYPIIGDHKYTFVADSDFDFDFKARGNFFALHCHKIKLPPALDLPKRTFVAPLPSGFGKNKLTKIMRDNTK